MPPLTTEELALEEKALLFVKSHRVELIKKFADPSLYQSVPTPVSLFMAGSPGAGKTEVSKGLIKKFKNAPVRIDADEIRPLCPGYTGANAHVFQRAANKGVNTLFDHVLRKNINCILDGTFAYAGADENIRRSLEHNRIVEVWFVYQDPKKAWEVTKARESREARHVSKEVFVEAFFQAKENARSVKDQFGSKVELNLLIKNYDDGTEQYQMNIRSEDLDRYTADGYSEDNLLGILV